MVRNTKQHSTAQYTQYNTAQYNKAQYSTAQYSTAQHSTEEHNTIQHNLGKHGKAQCRAAENIFSRLNTPCQKNNKIKLYKSNVDIYEYGNAQ